MDDDLLTEGPDAARASGKETDSAFNAAKASSGKCRGRVGGGPSSSISASGRSQRGRVDLLGERLQIPRIRPERMRDAVGGDDGLVVAVLAPAVPVRRERRGLVGGGRGRGARLGERAAT